MKQSSPLVSVIIPVRERYREVLQAARSVLGQSYQNIEMIVIDDGSDQEHLELQSLLSGTSHQLFRIAPSGVSFARNFGVQKSNGQWIAFLDSDDTWRPEKLEEQMAFQFERPELRILQTDESWIRHGKAVNKRDFHTLASGECFSECLVRCCISPSSVLIERSLFERSGGFDERLIACEDYDLWIRLSVDHEVGLVPKELIIKHGGHADQLSRSTPALDRLRAFGLVKLLLSETLSEERQQMVREELRRKLEVFLAGAAKRQASVASQAASSLCEVLNSVNHQPARLRELMSGLLSLEAV